MNLAITINDAYPWGRSFDEYRRMFGLTEKDFAGRIIGCADGPASFNAEMYRRGRNVVSCDPLLDLQGERSRHLEGLVDGLRKDRFDVAVVRVEYEFQRGGNAMLRVTRRG